ncbi:MAG: SDR family NAD(P)-dependent oxidoreductase [Planctomycetia bacterium]|nr:SDR family NAD(P)-dependent oxidoreductase [Planctomycetia bacterium]
MSESGSTPEIETSVDLGEISPQNESTDTDLTDLTSILVRVVSEKTGYPEDAIGIALDLEADLGIDSIKRVEILSALREYKPDLQAIPADKLGTLRSIEDISGWYTTSLETSPASLETAPASLETSPASLEISSVKRKEEKNGSRPMVATPVISELSSLDLSSEIELDTKNSWWLICDDENIRVAVEQELSHRSVHVISLPSHSEIPSRSNDSALGGMILIGNKTTLINDPLTSFRWLREAGKRLGNDTQGHASIHLVSRMDGQFGLSGKQDCGDPNSGHLLGLARCACREWPEFVVRGIDISSETTPAVLSKTLVQEIFHGEEMEVGLHSQGRCHTLLQKEETTGAALPRLSEGDLVVVTGGARGVTAACVDALTRTVRPSLLLLGRTPEPGDEPEWARGIQDQDLESRLFQQAGTNHSPAEVRSIAKSVLQSRDIGRRIEELENWGSSVTYRSLDVRNKSDLSKTLEEARALYGPVRGLIHGAGVLSDGWIVEKSDDQFLQVWSTKIDPALQLLELFKNDDLKILNFFSSTTASLGRKGQSDYAAANEVLNQLALRESQRRPHCHVRSLGWGPWDGGMVAEGLKDLFHSEGVGLISLTEGSKIFVEKLSTKSPVHQIVISPFAEDANFLDTIQSWPGPDRQRKKISTTSIIAAEHSVDGGQSDKKMTISSPKGSGDELELGLEMQISCERDPSLRHHVLHGRAVVPAALLLEWCTQVAIHRHPGLQLLGVDDFKILKGVVLDSQQSISLSIFTGKPESTSDALYIPVEIRTTGEQGRIHAKTRVLLGEREHTSSRIAANGIATSFVYDEQLFHGESYRCITKIVGLSDSGIAFSASGTPAPGELFRSPLLPAWRIDPLRIDAIFQGLIIWSRKNAGSPCLPCAIEKLRIHRDIQSGHLETRIEIDTFDPATASASAEILDHNGIPIMTISGAEVIIDGALEDAFSNQQLSEEAHP